MKSLDTAGMMLFIKGFPNIDLGQIKIRNLDLNNLDLEAKYYSLVSNNASVKKYLPGAYVENVADAKEKINENLKRHFDKVSITLCIARPDFKPIGYIMLNAPGIYNEIDSWTIDFWLHESMQGRGIMAASLSAVLNQIKDRNISSVLFFVKKDNYKALNVLRSIGLTSKIEADDKSMYRLGVKLN
jgi:RimJ/RimL family protein N-acetyltransferase